MALVFQEVFLPLYTLGILIVAKVLIPNPNYPPMGTQRQDGDIFEFFNGYKNNTVAVVPNSTETIVSKLGIIRLFSFRNFCKIIRWSNYGRKLNFVKIDIRNRIGNICNIF